MKDAGRGGERERKKGRRKEKRWMKEERGKKGIQQQRSPRL